MSENQQSQFNFDAIRLKIASPDDILHWSHGEVLKPETINYRTQKPEKDGLFCEKIFGPTKDWECYCGKYKRIRYKGIICDKCGVEVTRSLVRRERMGHIKLASPVSHIWFLRGVPSKLGLVLDISPQDLEKVIYFANFIIINVNEGLRQQSLEQIQEEVKSKRKQIENEYQRNISQIQNLKTQGVSENDIEKKVKQIAEEKKERLEELGNAFDLAKKELLDLKINKIISENTYHDLSLKYGHIFEAGIGAEVIHGLLKELDLEQMVKDLEMEMVTAIASKQKRIIKRLKLIKSLIKQHLRPEWMILTMVPVIPPDLRPMVQLDGGRFATSDLNDLYRRVINRNNRLKRLQELNAPEVICRNEKRMLQEAVDALIDNSARHGKTVTASTGQKRMLKSLADVLKGKQGRFRQNLLGKRVDYSGRSVIVVGPDLLLHQCGLPKQMALELFKPFVIAELIKRELVHNVRSANRFIDMGHAEVWDILEQVTKGAHVLLNRAPTLHRLGIQAFQPILIEGKAIQIHPYVCPPFNADFDGDQMAVHVPLTEEAKNEAANIMLSARNILKPATGEPVAMPSKDMVWGAHYMTYIREENEQKGKIKIFTDPEEAMTAYDLGFLKLQEKVIIRKDGEKLETSIGRIIINKVIPENLQFINKVLDRGALKRLISRCLEIYDFPTAVKLLDDLKKVTLKYITYSGYSWGVDDLPVVDQKKNIIKETEGLIDLIMSQYEEGLLTERERQIKVIETWAQAKDRITKESQKVLPQEGPVFTMVNSEARGTWAQITQMMGMKGLVTNPAGETIELPIKGSFKEGFDVLEYFISTHGARKGLTDTALRTANAGYLTRRLIDVAQDMVIKQDDCHDEVGLTITKKESEEMNESIAKRSLGRYLVADVVDPKNNKVIFKKDDLIDDEKMRVLEKIDLEEIKIRSSLTCQAQRGVCKKCYGWDLGNNKLVESGTAVGIIAAQSIGEPGTQLTLRNFHTGGVAGTDITQGLPRVEEIFEARPIKKAAILAPFDGEVEIIEESGEKTGGIKQRIIRMSSDLVEDENIEIRQKDLDNLLIKDGAQVKKGDLLLERNGEKVVAPQSGKLSVVDSEDTHGLQLKVSVKRKVTRDLPVPPFFSVWVKDGEFVTKGQQLTEGPVNLFDLYELRGKVATQKYVLKEIQYIYTSQGQKLNDKHIELIARQMFSRIYITDPGDTDFLPGEVVEWADFTESNEQAKKNKGKVAKGKNLLLGITKSSLSTSSFLSAASFQETARVLIDAAITGKMDYLRGLKENVIIGRLIPAGTGMKAHER